MKRQLAEVESILNRVRCPVCYGPCVELLDTQVPFAGRYTGIYRCLSGTVADCPVDTFDPTFKEARYGSR